MEGGEGPFGTPMYSAGETTEERDAEMKAEMKAEANRLRDLQERSVSSEIARTRSDAVLKLAQAARALIPLHGTSVSFTQTRASVLRACERLADDIR